MPPKFIDIHSHLQFSAYDADREEALKRAEDAGVWMINVGTNRETSEKAVELAEGSSFAPTPPARGGASLRGVVGGNISGNFLPPPPTPPLKSGERKNPKEGRFAAIGLHPAHATESFFDKNEIDASKAEKLYGKEEFVVGAEEFDYNFYKKLAENPKVAAIGECGLDYYRLEVKDLSLIKKKQEEIFRKQIELSIEVGKPLMLHLRSGENGNAYTEALEILKSYNLNLKSDLRGNLHSCSTEWETAKKFLDLGFTLSFTGVITFPPKKADKSRGQIPIESYCEIIRNVPLDMIMSETDCPYITPVPYRGKRNEPVYVVEVVKKIAEIRGENYEKVREQLVENAVRVFGLK